MKTTAKDVILVYFATFLRMNPFAGTFQIFCLPEHLFFRFLLNDCFLNYLCSVFEETFNSYFKSNMFDEKLKCEFLFDSHLFTQASGKLPPGKFSPIKLLFGEYPPGKFPPGIFPLMFLNIPSHPGFFFHYCHRYH